MSRSGAFYIVKVMEMAAAGTTATDTLNAPARRVVDHQARAARPDRSPFPIVRRALTAVGHVRGLVSMGPQGRSVERAGAILAPDQDPVLAGDQQIVAEAAARLGGAGDDRAAGQLDGFPSVLTAGPELAEASSRLSIGRR